MCDRISFSDKVKLLDTHFFLRSYDSLRDLDEAVDEIRKCLLVGEKRIREESKKWLDINNNSLDLHQKIREDIESSKLIALILGESQALLYDLGMIDTFRKEREKRMSEEIKPGFLGLGVEKKKRAYALKTDNAVLYLQKMQDSYRAFRKTVENDYDSLSRNEFFSKYSYDSLLDRF